MKIIELYGFSASGKTYKAKSIAHKENLDLSFILISKKKRLVRILVKFFYIFNVKLTDLIFLFKIHKIIKFNNLKYRIKNIFSFLFVIGFIRSYQSKDRSIIIDHGIIQCLFGCLLYSTNNSTVDKFIIIILKEYLNKLMKNTNYKRVKMDTNLDIIKKRLLEDKNFEKLKFLKKNKNKIIDTYSRISFIIKNLY
ncbi:hypothetical protein [Candidatus Pelagibacter sp. HIMB1495]|uniref:hypothetical protein n=1 Tax=unclassified Candidatus Pelagibacter TaxID=2647897 RepID=UPI003F876B0B